MDGSRKNYEAAAQRLRAGIARRIRENDDRLEREGKDRQGFVSLTTRGTRLRVVDAHPLPYNEARRIMEGSRSAVAGRLEDNPDSPMKAEVPVLYERHSSDARKFRETITEGKESNQHGAAVYVYDEDEYRDEMRMFTTDDGRAGVALHGDDIVSVYSTSPPRQGNMVGALMSTAIEQGGRRCDCFDTRLPRMYARHGMVVVARIRWDDEHAPDDWDKETFAAYNGGEPDVVFMAFDPDAVNSNYVRDRNADVFGDYEAAAAHTERVVAANEERVRAALRARS